MVDKTVFMETLRSVQELAKASSEPMSREELLEYFKDMELSAEQRELVYQYFQSSGEPEDSGQAARDFGRKPSGPGSSDLPGRGRKTSHSKHYQMYLNDISKISDLSQEGKSELYQRLLCGDRSAISAISGQWLKKITDIAKSYVTGRALVEDLVQEGNMGLLLGMEQLLGTKEQCGELTFDSKPAVMLSEPSNGPHGHSTVEQQLEAYVREAMEQYCRETEGTDHGESAILAKVNLVYEAQKILAEENGTIPSMQELSEYTRIPVEEVGDIMALSRKKGEKL